jgi:Sec-independent protein translocase protein TatA
VPAFFTDVSFTEVLLIAAAALIVFGRNLPEVDMRAAAQGVRLRRQLSDVWRQTGLGEELRKVRSDLEAEQRRIASQVPDWRKEVPDWRAPLGSPRSEESGSAGIREVEAEVETASPETSPSLESKPAGERRAGGEDDVDDEERPRGEGKASA